MSLKKLVNVRNASFFLTLLFTLATFIFTIVNITAPETFRLPTQCITTPCIGGITQEWSIISSLLYVANLASLTVLLIFQIKLSKFAKQEETIEISQEN